MYLTQPEIFPQAIMHLMLIVFQIYSNHIMIVMFRKQDITCLLNFTMKYLTCKAIGLDIYNKSKPMV